MQDQAFWPTVDQLLSLSNEELGSVDPVVMNLVVAKGVPALADLDIGHYVQLADRWAGEIEQSIPACDANFYRQPALWKNDLDFSRLAIMCWYVGEVLGIRYREDQQKSERVLYTDPGDLFLNGVMDTRQGTCGNMAALHVALGWRLGWPVSLACVGSHYICRYDDGKKIINVEASTANSAGTFISPPDDWYMEYYGIPQRAVDCGSDMRAITPREMLGLFLGLRARHLENVNRYTEAEPDYLLGRYLFPRNRHLYTAQNQVSVQCSMDLFEPHEKGHPVDLAQWLRQVVHIAPWNRKPIQKTQQPKETYNGSCVDAVLQQIVGGGDSV